jgi:hypothetical protein
MRQKFAAASGENHSTGRQTVFGAARDLNNSGMNSVFRWTSGSWSKLEPINVQCLRIVVAHVHPMRQKRQAGRVLSLDLRPRAEM